MREIAKGIVHIEKHEDVDLAELRAAAPDIIEIELIRPIKVGGDEHTQLVFEEPTGRHMEQMAKASSPQAAALTSFRVLAECVGLGPEELKELRSRDLTRLTQVLSYFLPDSRAGAA